MLDDQSSGLGSLLRRAAARGLAAAARLARSSTRPAPRPAAPGPAASAPARAAPGRPDLGAEPAPPRTAATGTEPPPALLDFDPEEDLIEIRCTPATCPATGRAVLPALSVAAAAGGGSLLLLDGRPVAQLPVPPARLDPGAIRLVAA